MIRILDICSGIGGFSLGLESTGGFDTVAFCEFDDFCRKVLNKHWPDVPIYKDLKEIGNEPERIIQDFDLICGGIPCQPFSVAGKKKGKEDDRHLWPYMYEIIKHKKPSWVIVENVGGFVNVALDDVCLDLEAQGYATQSFIIPACSVEAPHRRDRIWILGKFMGNASSDGRIESESSEKKGGAVRRSEEGRVLESEGASDMENPGRALRQGRIEQGENADEVGQGNANQLERSGGTSRSDVANSNDNGLEGGLIEACNEDATGQDTQGIRSTDTKDISRQDHDGRDSQESRADGTLSRSSDGGETSSSRAAEVCEVSKESDNNQGTSREDGHQEDNNRTLVQEGQSRVQSSVNRGLGNNQASLEGSQVRQGDDNSSVNRMAESKDVPNSSTLRSSSESKRNTRSLGEKGEEKERRGDQSSVRSEARSAEGSGQDVPNSSGQRLEGHRGEHGLREASQEEQAGRSSQEQDVSHAKELDRNVDDNGHSGQCDGQQRQGLQGELGGASGNRAEDVANTERLGQQGQGEHERPSNTEKASEGQASGTDDGSQGQTGQGHTEPGVGGMADGISARLDGHLGFEREPNIPRVATGIPERVNRLKALGNSIVPQVIYNIGLAILEEEERNERAL